jgi:hypothetical protein
VLARVGARWWIRAHHAHMGSDRVRDDVRAHTGTLLRAAVPAGRRRGRIFPRRDLLPESVVPRTTPCACDITLHDRYPALERAWGTARRVAAGSRWETWTSRMAVALSDRGNSASSSQRCRACVPHRSDR